MLRISVITILSIVTLSAFKSEPGIRGIEFMNISDTVKPVKVRSDSGADSDILVYLDQKYVGTISEIKNMDSLVSPEKIESINIFKGASAIAKYGENAKYGVIEIKTKKTTPSGEIADVKIEEVRSGSPTENIIFENVEVEASFLGGLNAWRGFLEKNLKTNVPVRNKAPVGTYTAVVQFIVDREGNISDIRALTTHGFGIEEECIRVMKKSPKWAPAIQNGRNVKAYKKQPITFVVMQ